MTPPLTGQRSRSELIAELYERHAAGLFAYCHDQLGETNAAADAVVAVFASLPPFAEATRAVLYALARREIYRRDVSYALPAVDSAVDPVGALVERVFRDIRPHQREVLLLSAVCGLTTPELALVLDVAVDTAEELTAGARRRFAQTLATAVTAARSAPYLDPAVAEVYDAIGVAPIEDVLARLPWRRPTASVRSRVFSSLPYEEPDTPAAPDLPIKKLWPTTPRWPLPLSTPDQISNTCVVQSDALASARSRRKAKHEAGTEPMPKMRGSFLAALSGRRRTTATTPKPTAEPLTEPTAGPAVLAPDGPAAPPARTAPSAPAADGSPEKTLEETGGGVSDETQPFDAFRPADAPDLPRDAASAAMPDTVPSHPADAARKGAAPKGKGKASKGSGKAPRPPRERHYDWAWELIGFLICLAIALLVFFAVPTMVTH